MKKEIEKGKKWFKSVTPKGTYDWYLKWIASVTILCAMSMRGVPELAPLDLQLSMVGVFLWLLVSLAWKDRALIILNGVGLLFLVKKVLIILHLLQIF